MKKIAILRCLKADKVCTGASCFNAIQLKKSSFARYAQDDLFLSGFLSCNGCGIYYNLSFPLVALRRFLNHNDSAIEDYIDAGMMEKLERLKKENVDIVHLGICTNLKTKENPKIRHECRKITQIANYLRSQGIEVVRGTHN